jgi:Na+/H+ antiporter NhaC
MLPIAVAMGAAGESYMPLLIGAVISGGVFGDHCSPISDTTIISSLAAGCDHIDHVRTQLPYALLAGIVALGMFLVAGYGIETR